MHAPKLPSATWCYRDALGLVAARLFISTVVWATGFRAISDDDFARVVIAQRFAFSPSLDPSGSSWLPFPFWLQGGAMLVAGPSLECARAVAVFSGVAGTLLVWLSARLLQLNRWQAIFAALLASVFPYAARLGIATVPEQLTAALILVGATSVAQRAVGWRLVGAAALVLATLSRYEAWPVAVAFSFYCAVDAARLRHARFLAPAALASLGMLLWLAHGQLQHADPLFFVKRVADYQAALGSSARSWWSAIAHHPLLLFRHEPELSLLALGSVLVLSRGPRTQNSSLAKAVLMLAALLGFLMLSDLRQAGATHHPERALLALWSFAALVIAAAAPVARDWLAELRSRGLALPVFAVLAVIGCLALARPLIGAAIEFVDRKDEVALGRAARDVAGDGRLLIMARDYGYFAMMAGFGDPSRAQPLDRHDPRTARTDDPLGSPLKFVERMRQRRFKALIMPSDKLARAQAVGQLKDRRGAYVLLSLQQKTDDNQESTHR